MLNEIRPTHRVTDKLREKAVQRYMRHSRQAQEKRTKEKTYGSRATKDALGTVKVTTDKVAVKFQKDTKAWAAGVNDKFEGGKTVFNASFEVSVCCLIRLWKVWTVHVTSHSKCILLKFTVPQDRLMGAKSPLKDLKATNQPLHPSTSASTGANSVHNSTQPGVFSERLKRFLLTESQQGQGQEHRKASGSDSSSSGAHRGAAVAEYDASSALNDLLAYFQQNVSANSVN